MNDVQLTKEEIYRIKVWNVLKRAALAVLIFITISLIGCPYYRVFEQRMTGKAELERAKYNRLVKTTEAEATRIAAVDLAAADTIRAHGIATTNKIIGTSLKNNEEYLHFVWLQALEKSKGETIYIPTEANFPILEAGRLSRKQVVEPIPSE